MTDLTTLSSIQDKVKERIQSTFMEFLPEEMFQGLVKEQTDRFITSTLPNLIQEELKASATAYIKAELAKPGWSERWSNNGYRTGDLVERVLKDSAPELVTALFSSMAANFVVAIRNGNIRF